MPNDCRKYAFLIVVVAIAISIGFSGVVTAHSDKVADGIETENDSANVLISVDSEGVPDHGDSSTDEIKEATEQSQQATIDHLNDLDGVHINNTYWITNVIEATVDTSETSLTTVASHDDIEQVSPNDVLTLPEPPEPESTQSTDTHTLGEHTYGLEQIAAPEAWDEFNTTGEGVNVTVLDTGVNTSHPDIELGGDPDDNFKGSWAVFNDTTSTDSGYEDFEGEDAPSPEDIDTDGHGTHVSGTVSGGAATGTHIGTAPNVTLSHAQVAQQSLFGIGAAQSDVIRAIEWGVDNDEDVISLSLGSDDLNGEYIDPIDNARSSGVAVVTSSGNDGEDTVLTPAAIENATSVGASDEDRNIGPFSSGATFDPEEEFGSNASDWENPQIIPFVAAPGVEIYSADNSETGLTFKSGTSMAAPHVAGAKALLLDNNPNLTPTEIELVLGTGAMQPDEFDERNNRSGYGIINVTNSLVHSDPNGYLTVSNKTVDETATIGDEITAEVNVTNQNLIGDTASRNVTFSVNGTVVDYETVTVGSDATDTIEFNHTTTDKNAGTNSIEVSTENDTSTESTVVEGVPEFDTSINESTLNSPIIDSRNETLTANITNEGDWSETPTVDLYINGTLEDSVETSQIEPNETEQAELTFEPMESQSPVEIKAEVNATGDNSTVIREVDQLGEITINESAPPSVDQGETVELATTYNVSEGANRTITPVIERNGDTIYTGSTTELDPSGAGEITIEHNDTLPATLTDDVAYNFTTTNQFDTSENETQITSIDEGPVYNINSLTTNFEDAKVNATVENQGNESGDLPITATQDGEQIGQEDNVSLSPNESTQITIEVDVVSNGTGELTVKSPLRNLSAEVEFETPPDGSGSDDDNGGSDDDSGSDDSGSGGGGGGGGPAPLPSDDDDSDDDDSDDAESDDDEGEGSTQTNDSNDSETIDQISETIENSEPVDTELINGDTSSDQTDEDESESGGSTAVESVEFSDGSDTTVSVEDYGEPQDQIKDDVVDSIAQYHSDVKAATVESTQEESEGNEINIVSLSRIEPTEEIEDEDTTATVTLSVSEDSVSNADQLTVYKEEYVPAAEEKQWIELEPSEIETANGAVELTVEADQFSLFTVGEALTEDDGSEIEGEQESETTDDSTEVNVPGFTVEITLLTVVITALIAKGRQFAH